MKPSVGRIVHYMLDESDAERISGRRAAVGDLHNVGNAAQAGQVFPMVITRVWGDDPLSAVNGQVFLDGNDCYWATSKQQVAGDSVDQQGLWFAPPFVPMSAVVRGEATPNEAQAPTEADKP